MDVFEIVASRHATNGSLAPTPVSAEHQRLLETSIGNEMNWIPIPSRWDGIEDLLAVPDDLGLMAPSRIGYLPAGSARPRSDWSSPQRNRVSQYVFPNTCERTEDDDFGQILPSPALLKESA